MPQEINNFWTVVVFLAGAFGMWVSYKKGKVDLQRLQRETIIKEYEIEQTIERSKDNQCIALENQKEVKSIRYDIEQMKLETRLILKANLNTMQSLKEHNINGKTSDSIKEINEYLINN